MSDTTANTNKDSKTEEFLRNSLGVIARNLGIPVEEITHDWSNLRYGETCKVNDEAKISFSGRAFRSSKDMLMISKQRDEIDRLKYDVKRLETLSDSYRDGMNCASKGFQARGKELAELQTVVRDQGAEVSRQHEEIRGLNLELAALRSATEVGKKDISERDSEIARLKHDVSVLTGDVERLRRMRENDIHDRGISERNERARSALWTIAVKAGVSEYKTTADIVERVCEIVDEVLRLRSENSELKTFRATASRYEGFLDAINSHFEIARPYEEIEKEVAWLIAEFSKMAKEIAQHKASAFQNAEIVKDAVDVGYSKASRDANSEIKRLRTDIDRLTAKHAAEIAELKKDVSNEQEVSGSYINAAATTEAEIERLKKEIADLKKDNARLLSFDLNSETVVHSAYAKGVENGVASKDAEITALKACLESTRNKRDNWQKAFLELSGSVSRTVETARRNAGFSV